MILKTTIMLVLKNVFEMYIQEQFITNRQSIKYSQWMFNQNFKSVITSYKPAGKLPLPKSYSELPKENRPEIVLLK